MGTEVPLLETVEEASESAILITNTYVRIYLRSMGDGACAPRLSKLVIEGGLFKFLVFQKQKVEKLQSCKAAKLPFNCNG